MALYELDMLDWDERELIEAFNRGVEGKTVDLREKMNEKRRRKWKVGDYCRAVYSQDYYYYEAKIIYLNEISCSVEFLGYGDIEDKDLLRLKESEGEKARRNQVKEATGNWFQYDSSIDECVVGDTTDGAVASYSSIRKKKQQRANTKFNATNPTPPSTHNASPPLMPTGMPFMPPPAAMPQHAVSAASPVPPCPSLANDPSIASMLAAWYMAGYYTGIQSAQKENHGCQCCCSHQHKSQ